MSEEKKTITSQDLIQIGVDSYKQGQLDLIELIQNAIKATLDQHNYLDEKSKQAIEAWNRRV